MVSISQIRQRVKTLVRKGEIYFRQPQSELKSVYWRCFSRRSVVNRKTNKVRAWGTGKNENFETFLKLARMAVYGTCHLDEVAIAGLTDQEFAWLKRLACTEAFTTWRSRLLCELVSYHLWHKIHGKPSPLERIPPKKRWCVRQVPGLRLWFYVWDNPRYNKHPQAMDVARAIRIVNEITRDKYFEFGYAASSFADRQPWNEVDTIPATLKPKKYAPFFLALLLFDSVEEAVEAVKSCSLKTLVRLLELRIITGDSLAFIN